METSEKLKSIRQSIKEVGDIGDWDSKELEQEVLKRLENDFDGKYFDIVFNDSVDNHGFVDLTKLHRGI